MKIYCVIGYYDMDDGMKRESKIHGCYVNKEKAKEKMKYITTKLANKFGRTKEFFTECEENSLSIFCGIDMATIEIIEQELDDYDIEEKRMTQEVSNALTIVLEDETVFPEVNDEEYDEIVSDIADNLLNDPELTLTNLFMNETRNRALNHPIIQQKRIDLKKMSSNK